ncbi:hypothetical protein AGMMS49992_30210 [Clostridia bacterium]|nr:hypothetical protein AGMMS49992_30210 [Clostridia bacterium]
MADDFSDILADPSSKKKKGGGSNAVVGTVLRVKIVAESWNNAGDTRTLNCGSFEIDGFDYQESPGSATASIKATSVPLDTSIRNELHSQGWEETTLQAIASDIAERGNLSLIYELDDDPELDRVDQRQEGDLAFLQRVVEEHGARLKVSDNQIIIFDEESYEQKPPRLVFKRGDGRLLSIKPKHDASQAASSATAQYKDPKSGKLVKEEFTPPSPPAVGKKLIVNARPSNLKGDKFREAAM